jgi:hypothetical protein
MTNNQHHSQIKIRRNLKLETDHNVNVGQCSVESPLPPLSKYLSITFCSEPHRCWVYSLFGVEILTTEFLHFNVGPVRLANRP